MAAVQVHKPKPPDPIPADLLLSSSQVARLVNCSPDSLRRLPVPGKTSVGRLVRYNRRAVEAWVAAGCPAPAAARGA